MGLQIKPGHTVLDVGCGPGTVLDDLATAVGRRGRVIGVDRDRGMVDEAVRRTSAQPSIEIRIGDAHDLPLHGASVDRARADRILMHVDSPRNALAELRRVLRPGGLVALAEPDWDTLVIDHDDVEASRAYTRYVATRVIRNGAIGRQLPRLATATGLDIVQVEAVPIVFRDRALADQILKPASVAARAVADGALTEGFTEGLTEPFLAMFTLMTVIARA
jgi:ubiquinone/menaquinone biosynthesis C-methylase UbiE